MTFQQTPFTVPLLLSGGFSSLLAIYVIVRTRSTYAIPSAVPFAVVPIAGAVWSVTYALQLASADLAGKVFWSRFVWLGAATVPTAWFIFLLAYTGRES